MNTPAYLSIKNTTGLKGILAIMVVISHIYISGNVSSNNAIISFILGSFFGYVPVSVFFFLSGYGLMTSYKKKGADYVCRFPRNRILPLYLISLIMIAIYSLLNFVLTRDFNIILLVHSLTLGGTVIKYGWYLQTILVLYFLFWVCFSFNVSERKKVCFFSVSLAVVYILLFVCGAEPTFYATAPCMLLGILWSVLSNYIDKKINTHFKKWICILLALCIAALFKITSSLLPEKIGYVFQTTGTAVCFTIAIILFLVGISLSNAVTTFLGNISLEIYVTQGIAIMLFSHFALNSLHIVLYGCLVIAATILLAYCIHPIFDKINKSIKSTA